MGDLSSYRELLSVSGLTLPTRWIALVILTVHYYTSVIALGQLQPIAHQNMNCWFGLQDLPVIQFININNYIIPTIENVSRQTVLVGSGLNLAESYYT